MPSWTRSPSERPWPWYLRATDTTSRRFELIMRSFAAMSPFSMRWASSISSAAVSSGYLRASLKKSWSESIVASATAFAGSFFGSTPRGSSSRPRRAKRRVPARCCVVCRRSSGLSPGGYLGNRARGRQDGVQEPWKPPLEVVPPERDHPLGPVRSRMGDPRLAEHLEVVRERRLRDRRLDRAAVALLAVGYR